MADFIFFTTEGFTKDPNGNDIENCQVLGIAKGKDKVEAKDNLLKDNPWIIEVGFAPSVTMFAAANTPSLSDAH